MKIGIIGLGLMGGSIYKKLKVCSKEVVGVGSDWVGQIDAFDLLILAVPIPAILEIGEKLASLPLKKPLLVLDIGSVKEPIAKKFEAWSNGQVEFLATHPMAGKEKSGFEHSDPTLFEGAAWVITPHAKNREASLQKAEELIHLLGANSIRMDAEQHDRQAALISHMPYLLSKALLDFVAKEDPSSLAMAGPGFKSMVRLADDNSEMHKEIARYNEANISDFLRKYIGSLLKNLDP